MLIGKGAFGRVVTVDDERVQKQISKEHWRPEEGELHALMDHPNIVRLLEQMEHYSGVNLILERCGTALWDYEAVSVDQTRRFAADIARALEHVHSHDVIHGDVKPHNILTATGGGGFKLCDFGHARRGPRSRSLSGTVNYMAPEIVSRSKAGHGCAVDVWALGVCIYWALRSKHAPFEVSGDTEATLKRIRECRPCAPLPDEASGLLAGVFVPEADRVGVATIEAWGDGKI